MTNNKPPIAAQQGVRPTAAPSIRKFGTVVYSGGSWEESVPGGKVRKPRLQYLAAPESSGRLPRIRQEVNDSLLLEPQYCSTVLGTVPDVPPSWELGRDARG